MRILSLSVSTLCFFMSAMSIANASEQKSCTGQLETRTNDLKSAKSELSAELQKLSSIKNCALDFDKSVTATNEIVTLEAEFETLVGQVNALKEMSQRS